MTEVLAGRKFRVEVLRPGPAETPGLIGAVGPDHRLASQVPPGRIGHPDEIATLNRRKSAPHNPYQEEK